MRGAVGSKQIGSVEGVVGSHGLVCKVVDEPLLYTISYTTMTQIVKENLLRNHHCSKNKHALKWCHGS